MSTDTPRAPLEESRIAAALSQYWRVSVVELTGSTQDDIAQRITEKKAIAGEVLTTEFQSAGRGRLDRKFEAPKSSAIMFYFYI